MSVNRETRGEAARFTPTRVAGGVACLLACAGATWLFVREESARATEVKQLRGELSTLRQQLDSVNERSNHPTVLVQAMAPAVQPTPAPSAAPDVDRVVKGPLYGLTPDERTHRLSVMNQARATLLEDLLQREPIDIEWSAAAKRQLQGAFEVEGLTAAVRRVDCKTTLCKVTTNTTPNVEGALAFRHIVEKCPWPTNGMSSYSRLSGEGFVYFAREDSQLPNVDPMTLDF